MAISLKICFFFLLVNSMLMRFFSLVTKIREIHSKIYFQISKIIQKFSNKSIASASRIANEDAVGFYLKIARIFL